MSVKVAINGFGRIGRLSFRLMADNPAFDIVAINDLTDAKTLAYLLKYDSSQGKFKENAIDVKDDAIVVDGKSIKIFGEKDPENLPWGKLGVDVVIESTGFFTDQAGAGKHIKAGAKKVIVSAPAKGDVKTIVFNVNDNVLDGTETVISGASCTTNCLAPVAKVLDDNFGLVSGLMTTVHGYTNDQVTLDRPHKDLRRGRAAAQNIIPTSTGAAAAVGKVLPKLNGRLDGFALRVPVLTGSLVDLTCVLEKDVTAEEINAAMKAAANETLGYNEAPIVSTDIIGMSYGSLFDATLTKVMNVEGGKQQVKIISWYDNEMSYTAQLVRLVSFVATQI
ncbi:type I glyceraldehyde-3-phosphate dehydrogenase [Acetobacterium fimetarium]|uniref:Glyceraldehyde-3-phosphate dehydrogenase n=1 Tax=Acetobacterium fimetarium TaxID=52691 RepID=A0ABR6WW14_9FIRM|nr:type I glyceraldehyde-3-phosphate dehydrogenase [Acetobacterium fimetarium]MBC3804812.1 type I glyceraldehyde-3-phosphate dehydrogenase [Acetobacterium fimetarium]